MFSETLIMFYFIGSGTAIKKAIIESNIINLPYEKIKRSKMIIFPHLTLNMIIIGTAFILIGAVDTGSISAQIQSIIFIIGFIHFLYTIKVQHLVFKENISVLLDIANTSKIGN